MTTAALSHLFTPFQLGRISLANRVVMAPMTRCRAIGNTPNALVAEYYSQRATAGLIITEGTSPSPNGLGYARIPGLFNDQQARDWKPVTDAVHAQGGHIFVQLMHTGRVSHPLNLPAGARVLGPSAVASPGQMWTDQAQMQPLPAPEAMSAADIEAALAEYVHAAKLAVEVAGFDGIELHGANGYLIDQFLNLASNQRDDEWGAGSLDNRARFALEACRRTAAAIGADRIGIRFSPAGGSNGMSADGQNDALYTHLAGELSAIGLAYIHVVDHSALGSPKPSADLVPAMRSAFSGGAFILSGNYGADQGHRAEADLAAGHADLIAFGRPFIANPDLAAKLAAGTPLTDPNPATFYTADAIGYTDYAATR